MIRSILVPLDGSPFGEHALPLAAWVARRAPADLHLVHAHHAYPPTTVDGVVFMDDLDIRMRRQENAYLDGVVDRLRREVGVSASTSLLDGDAATVIHERAMATKADLVVLSTHGRGPLGRFWLGSVANDLVRRLPMPILLVRPTEGEVELDNPPALKQILLPLDGSLLAEQMIEPALTLGGLMEATFTLVRVINSSSCLEDGAQSGSLEKKANALREPSDTWQNRMRVEAQTYLDGVAAQLRSRDLRVETCVVADAHAALGILHEAEVFGTDLIAMETHGRLGLSRLLLGSVADKVLRGGHFPVLLHRSTHA